MDLTCRLSSSHAQKSDTKLDSNVALTACAAPPTRPSSFLHPFLHISSAGCEQVSVDRREEFRQSTCAYTCFPASVSVSALVSRCMCLCLSELGVCRSVLIRLPRSKVQSHTHTHTHKHTPALGGRWFFGRCGCFACFIF